MKALALYRNNGLALRRDLLATPEALPAMDALERGIFAASTEKTIAEYDTRELVAEVQRAMAYIMRDVGYRSQTGDFEYLSVRIPELLKRYYPGFSMHEVRLAFEMSLTGELDEFLPRRNGEPDRGHYQSFSAEYFCKILNAYKQRRGRLLARIYDAQPKPALPPEDFSQQIVAECIEAWQHYKENGTLWPMSPAMEVILHRELLKAGLAQPVPEVEKDKALEAMTGANFGKDAGPSEFRKEIICTFERLKAVGKDLETYIH